MASRIKTDTGKKYGLVSGQKPGLYFIQTLTKNMKFILQRHNLWLMFKYKKPITGKPRVFTSEVEVILLKD